MGQPFLLPPLKLDTPDDSDDLTAMHDSSCGLSEDLFADAGAHPASWYILMPNRRVLGIVTPWSNDQEQMASKNTVCAMVHGLKAMAYSFVTEAYVASIKGDEKALEKKRAEMPGRLENWPEEQRDEILMVTTHAADHSYKMTKWIINSKGASQGRKPFLGPRIDDDYKDHSKVQGRMFDLFAQTPVHPKGSTSFEDFMKKQRNA